MYTAGLEKPPLEGLTHAVSLIYNKKLQSVKLKMPKNEKNSK
jgi:hypothetical protein